MIRPARVGEAERLRAIERAAGTRFAEVGMAGVAADEPMTTEQLDAYAAAGRAWVAEDDRGSVVGYAVVDVIDGCAHVEQVSVLPTHQGRGRGRALLEAVEQWAAVSGLPALTLTTFADVPWNRPLYEHLGFRVLQPRELTSGLQAVRDEETRHGLRPETRVCMRRDVAAAVDAPHRDQR